MCWWIRTLRKPVVVVAKNPLLAVRIYLILKPGINHLESRSFGRAVDSETIVNAQKSSVFQQDRGQKLPSDNIVISTLALLEMKAGSDRHYGVRQKKIQQIAES